MIYLNGNYCEIGPVIDNRDRGFLLGDGVFETILLDDGEPVFLQDHIKRLKSACDALAIPYPKDHKEDDIDFCAIIGKCAQSQNFHIGTASARITVSRGIGQRGLLVPAPEVLEPTVMVSVASLPVIPNFYTMMVSQYIRPRFALSSRYKTLNYLDNLMARNEAHQQGCDEAIMLNDRGRLACGSASTIFGVTQDNHLLTPSIDEGALPGITRQKIITLALPLGLKCEEARIEREQLEGLDIFFCNSLIGIVAHKDASASVISTLKQHYAKVAKPIKNNKN